MTPTLARLTLLAALAATQLTLAARAGVGDFVIMAGLSWLGGGVLLLEREEQVAVEPSALAALAALPLRRFLPGALLLLWALLVLSFAGRLYDPLFWALPLAVLTGLGLLAGASWRSPLLTRLALIGALLPAQGLFNALWPVEPLALLTARVTALLLWLIGRPAYASGRAVMLDGQVLLVDGGCTGHTTLSFCLVTLALLWLLFPLRLRSGPARLAPLLLVPVLLVAVFLLNAVRIAVLAYTVRDPGDGWWRAWRGFAFWHDGAGAQLFALLASGLVCLVYVGLLEWQLRRRRRLAR
ncbi:archaeosortase/exosortase family protein [Cyanobium sp. CH-040]|uniref:archaeosortase/exosortase family protein n=1 Tax=Cyanobium sp. CH-040 TaxID=2823708 RepID=UPI0020CD5863|nr:archaeosortase/exosortase family protein [Cyanobium sp. CH-040]MCP9927877.1 archaeosortase/exosortase family protein [Cyanobium sp. CH-040]